MQKLRNITKFLFPLIALGGIWTLYIYRLGWPGIGDWFFTGAAFLAGAFLWPHAQDAVIRRMFEENETLNEQKKFLEGLVEKYARYLANADMAVVIACGKAPEVSDKWVHERLEGCETVQDLVRVLNDIVTNDDLQSLQDWLGKKKGRREQQNANAIRRAEEVCADWCNHEDWAPRCTHDDRRIRIYFTSTAYFHVLLNNPSEIVYSQNLTEQMVRRAASAGYTYERDFWRMAMEAYDRVMGSNPRPDPFVEHKTKRPTCSNCSHYWTRRSLCTAVPDNPGRGWGEPDDTKPSWCPGWKPKLEFGGVDEEGECVMRNPITGERVKEG